MGGGSIDARYARYAAGRARSRREFGVIRVVRVGIDLPDSKLSWRGNRTLKRI
jgi:hypothetical protein